MRFNFPNDAAAVSRYRDELDHVAVFHYLRTETFDRGQDFREMLPSTTGSFMHLWKA
jgi:hypothetical protein